MNTPPSVQDLSTFKLPNNFRGKPGWYVQLWWIVQSTLFAASPQFMYAWRSFLLSLFGANIGKNVNIRPTVRITFPWKVSIGDYSWIGDNTTLYSLGEIEIGSNVVVAQRSYICTASHNYKKSSFDIYSEKITIEDEAFIATDVFVAPGVRIGQGVVVGARSSVFNNLPPMMLCYGNPAKPVRPRMNVSG